MRTDARSKSGLLTILVALAVVGRAAPARSQTIEAMTGYYVRLVRKAEKGVLPGTGGDVWRLKADLDLGSDFDPNRKEVEVFITTPAECPGCGGSAGGAFPEPGELHAHPLLLLQLLPRRGSIWSMWLDVPDNGFCRVSLTPRQTRWAFRARCRGPLILPPFLDTLDFQASVRIGDRIFVSAARTFKQVIKTTRRFP